MTIRLIDDAHRAWRFASVRLWGLYASIAVWALQYPEQRDQVIAAVPADLRGGAAFVLITLPLVLRLVRFLPGDAAAPNKEL